MIPRRHAGALIPQPSPGGRSAARTEPRRVDAGCETKSTTSFRIVYNPNMPNPPKLTDNQRKELRDLEPRLADAARFGNLPEAKRITGDIKRVLEPTGHDARLRKAKLRLFEAAMEAGEYNFAETGVIGVRKKSNSSTRLYLESTALLAIVYLRRGKTEDAKPLVDECIRCMRNIRSIAQQREFYRATIERFHEEAALGGLIGHGDETLDPQSLQDNAGRILATHSEHEIYQRLKQHAPEDAVLRLIDLETYSQRQLTAAEQHKLPSPRDLEEDATRGRQLFKALKRSTWRSLCDPECEVYQAWWKNGVQCLTGKKVFGAAIAASFANLKIGYVGLATCVGALVLKTGLDAFCETYRPKDLMGHRERA